MQRLTEEQIDQYLLYLYQEEKSSATISKYRHDIRHFYHHLPKGKMIDKTVVIQYKNHLISSYKSSSVNSMLSALNGLLGFLGLQHYRVKKVKVQRQLFCRQERELSREDYKKLLAAAEVRQKERLYFVIQTICGTGIRVSELSFITVAALRKGKVQVHCKNKIRIVWLPKKLTRVLLIYAAKQGIKKGSLFLNRHGRPLSRTSIWAEMKSLSGKAGVAAEKIFPHNLRHLFARCYLKSDPNLNRLADILGHSSIETTRIYTISTGKEHLEKMEKLDLII